MDKIPLWEQIERSSNVVLDADTFYISYNPRAGTLRDPDNALEALGNLVQCVGGMINGELEPQEETALIDDGPDGCCRILLGDFRKEYEAAWPDWNKCLAVYQANIDRRSDWSTDEVA